MNKFYGIEYTTYTCRGYGEAKVKVLPAESKICICDSESAMFTELANLKKDIRYGNFKLFTLTKQPYEI